MPSGLRHLAGLIAAALSIGTLSGCQAINGNPQYSQLRIITASPDAPGLDIYQNSTALAYNLGFGTVSSYIPISPGSYIINADTAGSRQVVSSSKVTIASYQQYTVLIGNTAANLQQITLTDLSQSAPTGQIALRFVGQATRVGAVDIYLVPSGQKITAVAPIATNVTLGTNTGYFNVAAGAYSIVIYPAGTTPAAPPTTSSIVSPVLPPSTPPTSSYSGSQVTYVSGAARTFVLIDQPLTTPPSLQVITADDFDAPGS